MKYPVKPRTHPDAERGEYSLAHLIRLEEDGLLTKVREAPSVYVRRDHSVDARSTEQNLLRHLRGQCGPDRLQMKAR